VGCLDSFKIIVKISCWKIITERKPIKNSTTNNTKGKEKQAVPDQFSDEFF
jgi:hypothetical protein